MKIIFKYLLSSCLFFGITSCSDMYDSIGKYIESGEIIYPYPYKGEILAGSNRVKFEWKLPVNHTVVRMKAFWNDGLDSLELPLVSTDEEGREFEFFLEDLEENSFLFKVHSYDEENNKSIAFEKTVNVFGPIYQQVLSNRGYGSILKSNESEVIIIWDIPEKEDIGVEIEYTNTNGAIVISSFLINDAVPANSEGGRGRPQESRLSDINRNQPIKYRTIYRPDGRKAVDIIYSNWTQNISVE